MTDKSIMKVDTNVEKHGNTTENTLSRFEKCFNLIKRKLRWHRSVFEQHIALFGESGSGKTTLLTMFYGAHQGNAFRIENGYKLLADNQAQGNSLLQSYYNITNKSLPPTRQTSTKFSFSCIPECNGKSNKGIVRLVWHDYPGGWLNGNTDDILDETDVEKTFSSLVSSDIAFLIVDGQKFKQDGERYLQSLFSTMTNQIAYIKQYPSLKGLLPLTHFPRIWVTSLTKSDLLPNMTADAFREAVCKGASDEIAALKNEISSLIDKPNDPSHYFSFCEDFLLFSSGEFDPHTAKAINVSNRKGLDVVLPLAFALPFQKACKTAGKSSAAVGIAEVTVKILTTCTTGWMQYLPLVGNPARLINDFLKTDIQKIDELRRKAIEKRDYLAFLLYSFKNIIEKNRMKNIWYSQNNDNT